MLRLLTRLPTPTFSKELLTGVPAFDDYLHRLDAELLGRASLRRVTLEEVRDHLLEQQTMLMEQGLASEAAAQQALEGFGPVDKLGSEQRREKTQEFFKNFVLSGFVIAGLLTVLEMVLGFYGSQFWLTFTVAFVYKFTFFGLITSLCMTFSRYQVSATKLHPEESVRTDKVIQVYTPQTNKILTLIMLFFSGSMLIVYILGVLGVSGIFPLTNLFGNFLMGYLMLLISTFMASCCTRITLDGNQLYIKSLSGRRHFRIAKIIEFQRQSWWRICLPPALGRTHYLTLETDQGMVHTLYLSLIEEMYESDRLVACLKGMKEPAYLKKKITEESFKLYGPLVMSASLICIVLLIFSDQPLLRTSVSTDYIFAQSYADASIKSLPLPINDLIMTQVTADDNLINLEFKVAASSEDSPVLNDNSIDSYNRILKKLYCSKNDLGESVYKAYGVVIKSKLFSEDGILLSSSVFDYEICSDDSSVPEDEGALGQ